MTVQLIAKVLVKAGLKKAGTRRENFTTIQTGHYTARNLKIFGLDAIVVQPKNGTTCETIQAILAPYHSEIKNGMVVIDRKINRQ